MYRAGRAKQKPANRLARKAGQKIMEGMQEQLKNIIKRQKLIEEKLDLLIFMEELPAYDRVTFWKREILIKEEMKRKPVDDG